MLGKEAHELEGLDEPRVVLVHRAEGVSQPLAPLVPPPAKVRMQAAQRIEMAIVHSAVREDKYSDFDIFAEALSQLVRKAEQPSGSSSASTVGGLEEKIGQVRAFCSSEVALLRREVRQLQNDICGLQAMIFPASAPGTPATTTTTELTASQPAGAIRHIYGQWQTPESRQPYQTPPKCYGQLAHAAG